MNIEVAILNNEDPIEIFVESTELKALLTCNYSAKWENRMIDINEQILKYEWYRDGVRIIGEENKYLSFDGISQELNGTYECRIIVKDKQTIESQTYDLIVYKCKIFLFKSKAFFK